jgi:hypothetical protein
MRGGSKDMPTISSIIYEYIASKKEPATYHELAAQVKARRSDLKSRDLGATVRSVLQRGNRFVKTAPGIYRLKEG